MQVLVNNEIKTLSFIDCGFNRANAFLYAHNAPFIQPDGDNLEGVVGLSQEDYDYWQDLLDKELELNNLLLFIEKKYAVSYYKLLDDISDTNDLCIECRAVEAMDLLREKYLD